MSTSGSSSIPYGLSRRSSRSAATGLRHEVSAGIDVSTLRLEPRTYLDKDHREYFADLSASVRLNGRPARVYVLFEHKSWSDAGTLLQLLRYMVQVWSRERRSDGAKQLTPVIPVVVYHGEGSAPRMSFHDLFDLPDSERSRSLLKYIPAFEAALVDVSHMPEWQLEEASPALSAGLWSLRVARGTVEDFLEVVNRLGKRWGRTLLLDPGFELLLTYMLQGSGLSPFGTRSGGSAAIGLRRSFADRGGRCDYV